MGDTKIPTKLIGNSEVYLEDLNFEVTDFVEQGDTDAKAFSIQRANHTGTQTASTISDFSSAADARIAAQRGAADGVASLDSGGKVPASQLPNSIMEFKGTWDPSTNTPTLTNGSGSNQLEDAGHVYIASTSGTVNFGAGSISFAAGDWVVLSASLIWEKSVNSNAVASVNGHTGVVVLDNTDVGLGNVDNVSAANLRDRSTHTGTQLASTISDFTTAVQGVTIGASQIDGGTVSNAEFATLDGINTGTTIQTQIDGKQATITGAATSITSSNLTASKAVVSDSSGKIAESTTTSTEIGYLSGTTSSVQTQLGGKANLSGGNTFTGKQVMTPSSTDPGLNLGSIATDPSAPADGDGWYNSTSGDVKYRKNGVTVVDRNLLGVRVLTTGTTYTPTAGTKYIQAVLIGGGGGGGGVSGAGTSVGVGGGGGAGAMLIVATSLTGAASYTIAIGALGAGGVAGNNPGTAGTATTLTIGATTYSAAGGSGGTGQTAGTTAAAIAGGAGGTTPTGGTINVPGHNGNGALRVNGTAGLAGKGADSQYGAGGLSPTTAAAGNAATGYGAGGSGAYSTAATNRAGGNGSAGVIIITEYA